ncbi:hypothetical protein QFC22_003569 [Naganishia vaughanmartiniae]|uniref:Uncharacterized protein n=1 Tax=Naganishia vaughanmartiniae TaxID=1424756 RepID=A0ACC2X4Y9_9TREE|nr:hypothetical protein QFC22_003569 [Naganishia vaughanmartiniae]
MAVAPFALKRALRKVTQQRINVLPVEEIERQSQRVLDHLRESGVLDGARAVGCYLSMQKDELSTDGIVKYLLARGTALYVPIIPSLPASSSSSTPYAPPPPSYDMRMLRLYSTQDWESLKRDKWGIPDAGTERKDVDSNSSREDCMSEDHSQPPLDVILVPGVAFDSQFQRLGHGKGYYDRRSIACGTGPSLSILEHVRTTSDGAGTTTSKGIATSASTRDRGR